MSATPSVTADATHADASFEALAARYPANRCETAAGGIVGYREAAGSATNALPVVLLHGIGSGAASWVRQLDALGGSRRVLAWDAPGYGESTPVAPLSPFARDYFVILSDWLDMLKIERCVLVGHSLGAIVAGGFAAEHSKRVAGLLLLSPAGGYGAAPEEVRVSKRDQRLAMLEALGPQGLADKRSANMLSPHADDAAREWVRWNMSRVIPHGYAQATRLLANADLAADLANITSNIKIAVGDEDTITTPEACAHLAETAHTTLQRVPLAGHAGYIEQPAAYTTIIDTFCRVAEAQPGAAV